MRQVKHTQWGPLKDARGYWRVTKIKYRSLRDLLRIVNFPRCPPAVRDGVNRRIDGMVAEARRYTEADYQEVRRNLYPARKAP